MLRKAVLSLPSTSLRLLATAVAPEQPFAYGVSNFATIRCEGVVINGASDRASKEWRGCERRIMLTILLD
jgi:hypothetical protein